jgi:hypothetical protein
MSALALAVMAWLKMPASSGPVAEIGPQTARLDGLDLGRAGGHGVFEPRERLPHLR